MDNLSKISFTYTFIISLKTPIKRTVKLLFDILHGIARSDVTFIMLLEFMILLNYDGQLSSDSVIEKELFTAAIDQFKNAQMTNIENALVWMYIKTWGLKGQHVIEHDIWNFGKVDFDAAVMAVLYPRKEEPERVKLLKELILEKYEATSDRTTNTLFHDWSQELYSEVCSQYFQSKKII